MKLKRSEKEIAFARIQGRRVYQLRRERKMTRRQLAIGADIHPAMLFRIEMGDSTASAFQLDAIARALAAPREEFFPSGRIVPMVARPLDRPTFTLRRAFA